MTLAPLLNQLIEKQDKEIMELRAWKAKAMPFLEYLIELGFRSDIQINLEEGHFKQLTELLGGDDE